jgi:hypothetical protein
VFIYYRDEGLSTTDVGHRTEKELMQIADSDAEFIISMDHPERRCRRANQSWRPRTLKLVPTGAGS